MKKFGSLITGGLLGGLLLLTSVSANATVGFWINFDELGNITGNTANHFPPGIDPIYQVNPPPILNPNQPTDGSISYVTETPNGMHDGTTGYVRIWDGNQVSDILYFLAVGQQYINVWSDPGETGDVNQTVWQNILQTVNNYTGLVTDLQEQTLPGGMGDGVIYLPVQGQVGWGGDITYTFISDPSSDISAPDGGTTASLLGIALLGIAALKRKMAP